MKHSLTRFPVVSLKIACAGVENRNPSETRCGVGVSDIRCHHSGASAREARQRGTMGKKNW